MVHTQLLVGALGLAAGGTSPLTVLLAAAAGLILTMLLSHAVWMHAKKIADYRKAERIGLGMFGSSSIPLLLAEEATLRILDANCPACRLYGFSREEMLRKTLPELSAEPEETMRAVREHLPEAQRRLHRAKDGTVLTLAVALHYFQWRGRGVVLVSVRDIRSLVQSEEALRASEARLRAIIANISEVISILGPDGTIHYISPNIETLFGSKPEELIGKKGMDALHPDDARKLEIKFRELLASGNGTGTEISKYRHIDGDYRFVEATAVNMLSDPDIQGVLVSYRDITEKLRQQEEIRRISFRDSLTGLYNRTYLELELDRLDAADLPYSVVMGDVDGLKLTNDLFGHAEGNRLLALVAGILRDSCGDGGVAARTGGDEFCLLLPGADEPGAKAVCDRIYRACAAIEIATDSGSYHPSVSLGYAAKLPPAQSAAKALNDAEDFVLKRKLLKRKSAHSSLIASIRATMYEKSHETKEHADRLVASSRAVGRMLGLGEWQLDELELLAELHDIGKISVDERILTSPCRLTEEEWAQMRRHPEVGYRIALASPELKPVAEGILCHHERWDGGGYPQKLKGAEIPLSARILAVVDAFDAMTSDRAYRKAMPRSLALHELSRCSGAQFDPAVVQAFLTISTE